LYLYSVFQPAGFGEKVVEQAVLVRQGFSRAAFLFTPVWAILNRLWLVLALWGLWVTLTVISAVVFHLDPVTASIVYTLGALVFGFEADRARERALTQKGMLLQGLTLGDSERDAEQLYFGHRPFVETSSAPPATVAFKIASAESPDILGLFPPREPQP
jgi:hypothetical protein